MPSAHRRNSFQSSFPVVNLASLEIPAYKGKTTVSPGLMRERKTSNDSSEFNPTPLPGFNDNVHRDNQSVSSHQYQPQQPQPQYINPNPYNPGLAGAAPHFLEAKISLPVYDPTPFGRKPVKIKPESKDLIFNGTNMEISDFTCRLEKAAQVDGALGSDIAIQVMFSMKGETLVKEVQEMAQKEDYDWEKIKEKLVQRWGKMLPLLKYKRTDLDKILSTTSNLSTQKKFQDFNIQVDNLVAYLIRVQHMLSVEEIRHSVLMCLSEPIRMAVTKELIRDNHMTLAVDRSHILPPYHIIVAYIQKELRTITILENDENLEELKVVRPSQPQKFSTPYKSVDELTKTLSSWNTQKQKPTPFVSASHVPYKPAQHEKDLSHLKCHYCFGKAHTLHKCNLVYSDELDKLIKKEGTSIFLPGGTQSPYDRTRPYKQIVDQYHASRTQPGIINLPPGITTQKAEPVPEAKTSFRKLEEIEHQDHHCYDCEMAKRLRSGKEIEETPSAMKSRTEREETVDTRFLHSYQNPSPSGLTPASNPPTPPKKVSIQAPEDGSKVPKEKAQKKTTVERPLANQYPYAEDKLVKQMLENRMNVSVGELLAVSPSVTEKFKKLVSSKRVPVDQTKSSNTEGMDPQEDGEEEEVGEINIHYSCPLGYVTLSVNGRSFQALLDNGSQVNLMS
ncbi:hypothetical protein PSTG_05268 [Puccinia striiformis f. sp. tritici PST-78]|uniref:Aspartic peptidase DDI1-type domain-containing protein n=1 Tax=Puccinia striiformis f. sp. tritici PST-78 TaxID=1165861 RepID=A0A0L0VQE2_9BASI|nr:hypothetical protein PSTG_05268 [Puccinia striiformis f. sp. tritici PST-78]